MHFTSSKIRLVLLKTSLGKLSVLDLHHWSGINRKFTSFSVQAFALTSIESLSVALLSPTCCSTVALNTSIWQRHEFLCNSLYFQEKVSGPVFTTFSLKERAGLDGHILVGQVEEIWYSFWRRIAFWNWGKTSAGCHYVVFFNSISWDKVALRGNLLLSSPFVRYDSHHISIHITSLGRWHGCSQNFCHIGIHL